MRCALRFQCPRSTWAYCQDLLCRVKKKGKQMMELHEGDRVRVEYEVIVNNVGVMAVNVTPIGWQNPLAQALDRGWVKEIIERAKPEPGDILGIKGEDARMRVISVDGEYVFGRYVVWNSSRGGWDDSSWNGHTHGIMRLDVRSVIERAKE